MLQCNCVHHKPHLDWLRKKDLGEAHIYRLESFFLFENSIILLCANYHYDMYNQELEWSTINESYKAVPTLRLYFQDSPPSSVAEKWNKILRQMSFYRT